MVLCSDNPQIGDVLHGLEGEFRTGRCSIRQWRPLLNAHTSRLLGCLSIFSLIESAVGYCVSICSTAHLAQHLCGREAIDGVAEVQICIQSMAQEIGERAEAAEQGIHRLLDRAIQLTLEWCIGLSHTMHLQ